MLQKNLSTLSQTAAFLFLTLFCAVILNQPALAVGVCTNVSVGAGSLVPVGFTPRSVVPGDIDGDGDADLAVANSGGFSSSSIGTISILLNDGAGNFTPGTTLASNFSPQFVTLADFNLDGIQDLAVAGNSSSFGNTTPIPGLSIYYGTGGGLFGFPTSYNTTGGANALAITDLNRDDFPDIVVATPGNAVQTFINNGYDFTLTGTFTVGNSPRAVIVADINGDNNLDIVTANQNNNISVLYGQANGSFGVGVNVSLNTGGASFPNLSLAAGDLNNDNQLDLVLGTGSSTVAILLNNGAGGFTEAPLFNTQISSSIQNVLLGRFFGGSNLDLAVVMTGSFSDEASRVVLYRGNGAGGFDIASQITLPTGVSPFGIASADFNRDGVPDLAVTNQNSNNVSILLSNNTGGFAARQSRLNNQPIALAAGDFNGDGIGDAVVGATSFTSPSSLLSLYINDGSGNFIAPQNLTIANNNFSSLLAAELSGDSRLDLIAFGQPNFGTNNSITVYINNGTQTPFTAPATSYNFIGFPTGISVGDFNRDGRRDILAALPNNNSVALLLGGANGTFSAQPTYFAVSNQPTLTGAGDFNGDGLLDAAVATGSGGSSGSAIVILLGNGAGSFTQISPLVSIPSSPGSLVVADFNSDSRLDVAVASTSSFSSSSGSVSIAFGTGDGRLINPISYPVGLNPRTLRVADFNGDSRPDLVVANRNSNTISLLINNAGGSFTTANYLSGVFPNAIEVGDFYPDGRIDILSANQFGGLLPGTPTGTQVGTLSLLITSCKEAITKTDYTGDGRTDFAVFRPASGTWFVTTNGVDYIQQQFGTSEDVPVPADYDGDGETDFAVFRPSNRTWYIFRSSTNGSRAVQWGAAGDIPVPGDYNADGRADIAVFRPSNGTWYILPNLSPSQFLALRWGASGDVPVQADYDGDGRTDLAVYRAGTWFILNSSTNSIRAQQFGVATDTPVVGDYDGDGKSDLAVFRSGSWFMLLSSANTFRAENFGIASDRPQPGDYDGDGKTDLAVYRDGAWYIRQSSNNAFRAVTFGNANDIPVASTNRIQ